MPRFYFLAGALACLGGQPAGALAAPPFALAQKSAEVTPAAALELKPESGVWDLSKYEAIQFRVRNAGKETAIIRARASNAGGKGSRDTVGTAAVLEPGKSADLRLPLTRRPQDPTYAPFKPFFMYYHDMTVRENTVDPSAIVGVTVALDSASPAKSVFVDSAEAVGNGVPSPVPFFPLVDKYGQYTHADWPGKIDTDADFQTRRAEEEAELELHTGPKDWDRWGGWKSGPKEFGTGYFYPKKISGKWWLVDPDGQLFWSYGPTGVGFGEGTPVSDRENWFADLPSKSGPFAKYWGRGRNARFMFYQNKNYDTFDFSGLNAERKYGPSWKTQTVDFLHRRLRNWGFNSLGNWSDRTVMLRRKTPYTVAIGSGGPSLEHIPDVFDPKWQASLRARMERERGATANDPWNIGYFVDNELTWGILPNAAAAVLGALKAPAGSASKRAFVDDLRARYHTISELNAAWKTSYPSWNAVLDARMPPDAKNPRVLADAEAFGAKFTEKYFSTVRDEVKRVAPKNLYLGVRFNGHIDPSIVRIAAKYADVISYNIYEDPTGRLNQYLGKVDKPFLVGEFGVSSDLGQSPWRGEMPSSDSEARLRDMEKWFDHAIHHPSLVGAHFFQFGDQPTTGRGDDEATLRGFVNGADTPHFDLVQLNRRQGYSLYQTRSRQGDADARTYP